MPRESMPILFRQRFILAVRRSDKTKQEKDDLLKAAKDDGFLRRLIKQTKADCGGPLGGNWVEWLKGLPWLQIIGIALSLLTLIMNEKEEA